VYDPALRGMNMKLAHAIVFATVCIGAMVYSMVIRMERNPSDASQNSPLRIARRT